MFHQTCQHVTFSMEDTSMKFCPKCNSFCESDLTNKQAVCVRCGHIVELEPPKKITNNKVVDEKVVVVFEKLRRLVPLPRTIRICPKCGNKEAYVTKGASRSEDDFEEEVYRCTECGHKWRE